MTLLGERYVGKTMLINQYINKIFINENANALPNDIKKKEIILNKNKIELIINDISGELTYLNNIKFLLKNTNIALLVYDVTNKKSFERLDFWKSFISNLIEEKNIFICVIANKTNLYINKEISFDEGEKYANSINAIFKIINIKNNKEVENSINDIINKYIEVKNINLNLDNNNIKNVIMEY